MRQSRKSSTRSRKNLIKMTRHRSEQKRSHAVCLHKERWHSSSTHSFLSFVVSEGSRVRARVAAVMYTGKIFLNQTDDSNRESCCVAVETLEMHDLILVVVTDDVVMLCAVYKGALLKR